MARPSAPSYQRQSQPTDVKRAPAALPPPRLGLRKTGGIRVLDKSTTSSSRQVSDSKTSQSDPSALYKRVFYPNASDAPARILATPGTEQLDIQLYNLLALICRGFISPWYSKVSRDRAFLLEIVRVASYVFRRIEDKLVGTDSEEPIDAVKLLCVSIPGVLQRHVRDFRQAKEMEGSAYAAGVGVPYTAAGAAITPFEAIFHSLQPHAAIASSSVFSTSGSTVAEKLPTHINADYVRALVDSMLREVLPKEDYTAETEKAVVREVMVGIILAGVFNKVSQPWFIHGLIVKFLERKDRPTSDGQENVMVSVPRPSVIKRVSDFCAAVPVLFYRVTALFTYLSLLVVTALATPYISKTRARDLARRPISLTFTFVDSGKEGRQILSQARWLLATSSTIFGSLLDKSVSALICLIMANLWLAGSSYISSIPRSLIHLHFRASSRS